MHRSYPCRRSHGHSASRIASLILWVGSAFQVRPAEAQSVCLREQRSVEPIVSSVGEELHDLLGRLSEYGFSGTVLVADGDEVILHRGYGLADVERQVKNSTSTLFDLASITKTLTGAAVLRLEESGALDTSDRLERFIGELSEEKSAATVHQLATHTAGLVVRGFSIEADSRARFIQNMKDAPVESPPGAEYRYTNAGFSLLAAIVELASGRSFEEFVELELLRPACIDGARFGSADIPGMARGYQGGPDHAEAGTRSAYRWGERGAGGWVATVGDLYRWFMALRTVEVLGREATDKAFHRWGTEGYGWHVENDSRWDRPAIHKGGDIGTFTSQILFFPDEEIFIAWASNGNRQRWRSQLNDGLARLALGEAVELPPPVLSIDAAEMGRLAARYVSEAGEVEVRVGDGGLYLSENALGLPAGILFRPTGSDTFTGLLENTSDSATLGFAADGWLRFESPALSIKLERIS